MAGTAWTNFYIAIRTSSGNHLGLSKFNPSSSSDSWYAEIDCSAVSSSECFADHVTIGSGSVYLHYSVIDKADDLLFHAITSFSTTDGSFSNNWLIEFGTSSSANNYRVVKTALIGDKIYEVL